MWGRKRSKNVFISKTVPVDVLSYNPPELHSVELESHCDSLFCVFEQDDSVMETGDWQH